MVKEKRPGRFRFRFAVAEKPRCRTAVYESIGDDEALGWRVDSRTAALAHRMATVGELHFAEAGHRRPGRH